MNFVRTRFRDDFIIKFETFSDNRGEFIKWYSKGLKNSILHEFNIKEYFTSISRKDVIRGIHFQTPPSECKKFVHVLAGSIIDVIIDLRVGSPTYGKFESFKISAKEGIGIFVPIGFGHGFLSLEDKTVVSYLQSAEHSVKHDQGIRYDSFGFSWPVNTPILSERDSKFPHFKDFYSPFNY